MELRVKEICKEKGILFKDLAEKLGVTDVGLRKQVQGNPTIGTLEKIADALGVNFIELFVYSINYPYGVIRYKNKSYTIDSIESLRSILSIVESDELFTEEWFHSCKPYYMDFDIQANKAGLYNRDYKPLRDNLGKDGMIDIDLSRLTPLLQKKIFEEVRDQSGTTKRGYFYGVDTDPLLQSDSSKKTEFLNLYFNRIEFLSRTCPDVALRIL